MYTLVLGGARSGKSETARRLAEASGLPVTVIATATAADEEMADRIARHRERRPPTWSTVEEPLDLVGAIDRVNGFVVVDCLTLWVSNQLGGGTADDTVVDRAESAARALADRPDPGVVVSNEVGSGIVPANPMARRYRDLLGRVNMCFARRAARAWLVVAGRVLELADPWTT